MKKCYSTNRYFCQRYIKEEDEIKRRTHTIGGFTYVPLKKRFLFGDYDKYREAEQCAR